MSMDLEVDCPHCEALAGKICTEKCEVNGVKVQVLRKALETLGLSIENIKTQKFLKGKALGADQERKQIVDYIRKKAKQSGQVSIQLAGKYLADSIDKADHMPGARGIDRW